MRISHVITKLDVGGAQTHVIELALGQAAAGHSVEVVAGLGGPAADRLVAAGIPVRLVAALGDSHSGLPRRGALAAVTDAVRRVGPEIVHGHSSHGGLAARLAARRLGVPSVYTAHGWPFQRGAALKQRVMSLAGEFVGGRIGDAVIVLTNAERARAVRAMIAPRERLWAIPNGISDVPPELRRTGVGTDRPPVLVMVARFAPPKMHIELIEALAQMRDLDWQMRFVGDGPLLADARAAVRRTHLLERVEFLGHRDDVAAVLAASDIGILWSRYEGLPTSVMEYMRAGLCCVASDLPGSRELLGPISSRAVASSTSDLRNLLGVLTASPTAIDELGALARERYENQFTAAAMVARIEVVYRSVTARTSQQS